MKVSTFCSGIGSPEVALKNLGIEHEIVLTAEIDKYARETYLANHYTKKMVNDMTDPDYIGDEYYSDLNISGLPCQSFSLAGKRLGELDPRGLLFFDFLRYVKNQQPKYFIIENVKGLLSDNGGETFQNWIHLLGQSVNGNAFFFPHEDSLMYNLHWQVLNTKDYGLPQNRERVFLVGIRNDLPNSFVFPKGVPLKLRLKDILEAEVDEKYYLSDKMLDYLTTRKDNFNNGKINYKGENDIASCINASSKSLDISDNILKIPSATKSGYEIATEGTQRIAGWFENENVIGAYRDDAKISSVSEHIYQKENSVCNTIQTAHVPKLIQEVAIGAMRGRKPTKSKRRSKGGNYQQTLEINENGTSNCLSTVQKDNLVVENMFSYRMDNPIDSNSKYYPTLRANAGGKLRGIGLIENNFRIRKLTPKECFRLQGFPDKFVQNAIDAGVSNSQLYKQAGNSISVPVIQAILKNLLKDYLPN